MSLQTDSIFIKAISSDSGLSEATGNRIYGTAIPMPDAEAENVPLPYIIVSFDGMQNSTLSKEDYEMEGDEDVTTVSVEVVAGTLEALHTLTQEVRSVVRDYFADVGTGTEEYDEVPVDYSLSAGSINYDSSKPCYWQVMTYQCATKNIGNGKD